ncbi:MAG: hypothetical protein FJX92_02360 [Bacteroidetes bacterium]|nr:hypothetical protein [Bacteroidota bacterium]
MIHWKQYVRYVGITMVILLIVGSFRVQGQGNKKYSLRSEPTWILEINDQNPCPVKGAEGVPIKFKLNVSGVKKKYKEGGTLTITITYQDCYGQSKSDVFGINLNNLTDGSNSNPKWFFNGTFTKSSDKIVAKKDPKKEEQKKEEPKKEEPKQEDSKCKNEMAESIRPSIARAIKPGEQIDLEVVGGRVCSNAKWVWYAETANVTRYRLSETGKKISITLFEETTFFVRVEGPNDETEFLGFTVSVEEAKREEKKKEVIRDAVKVEGVPGAAVCPATSITLKVTGGVRGQVKKWAWYENKCGMGERAINKELGASSITVSPEKTTTYFVKDLNDTEDSKCYSFTITTKSVAKLPSLEVNNNVPVSLCAGESVTLRVTSSSLAPGVNIRWYSDPSGQPIGFDKVYVFDQTQSTTLYVRSEAECNAQSPLTKVAVVVNPRSTPPSYIRIGVKQNGTYPLEVVGGSLGDSKAQWTWYKGDKCEGLPINLGSSIRHSIKKGKTVSVRAEGGLCGSSTYVSRTIDEKTESKKGFINVGVVAPVFTNLSITAGYKFIYARFKTSLKTQVSSYDITEAGANQYVIANYPIHIIDYYEFNGSTLAVRSGFTGGLLVGGKTAKVYLGAGVGSYSPLWGVDIVSYSNPSNKTTKWGTLVSESRSGLEAEAGLFLKLGKSKSVNLMGGVNAILDKVNGTYMDATVGLGISF